MTDTIVVLASYAESLLNFREPLLRVLHEKGYHIVACAPACVETERRLKELGVDFVATPLRRTSMSPFADLRYLICLVRLLRRRRPVATIAYTAKPVIWGSFAARIAGVPKICAMITGVGSALIDNSTLTSGILTLLYRGSLALCSAVAFQNPDDEAEFVDRGLLAPGRSFRVNGSGVPLDRFTPAALPDSPVFLLIARLLADKGIREFAAAARQVKARYPFARFRLAGWFDDNPSALSRDEVEGWVKEGILEYVGRLHDVRPEIAAARVYVLPSYREGTPRTVLEAMAMARPVITTDAPGCRETVKDGWNGVLVPVRNVELLAAAMLRFIEEPAAAVEMGKRSRELALVKFDARLVARELVSGFGL